MNKMNRTNLILVIMLMLGAIALVVWTQQTSESALPLMSAQNWIILGFALFLILVFRSIVKALDAMRYLLAAKDRELMQKEGSPGEDIAPTSAEEPHGDDEWLNNLMHKLTDATPVEEEDQVATDHVYDGIRELDNNLPPWWLAGFYISIVFAVVYLLRYHVFDAAPLQEEEFKMEMAAAEVAKEEYLKTAANLIDESTVEILTEESRLVAGQSIFDKNCAVCHAKDGGGGVGPNLTDNYWIHGNSIADVFSTVKYGVPAKGMIPWQDQLSPAEIQEVSSYVLTLVGTTPADPKEPQGESMAPQTTGAPADSTGTEPADTANSVESEALAGI